MDHSLDAVQLVACIDDCCVLTIATKDQIVWCAVPSVQAVPAILSEQDVALATACELIPTGSAIEKVVAFASEKLVVAWPAYGSVVAPPAEHPIMPMSA